MEVNAVSNSAPITSDNESNLKKDSTVLLKSSPDTVEISANTKKASKGDKVLAGGASFLFSGVGQLLNGEGKKGAKFFGKEVLFNALTAGGSFLAFTAGGKNPKVKAAAGIALALTGGIAAIVNKVQCVLDAVKNADKN